MPKEIFGVGSESTVFQDPNHPERLEKVNDQIAAGESAETIKGRFYLTKILHLLLPANIPDIYAASAKEPSSMVVEKKSLDFKHRHMQRMNLAGLKWHEYATMDALIKQMEAEPGVPKLRQALHELGLVFDRTGINFGFDDSGHAIYVDKFSPWSDRATTRYYNPAKLQTSIQKLPLDQQATATRYLERLEELFKQEAKKT